MHEIIRFAWGKSSLGDFMVAVSEKGIVALEFNSDHSAAEDALPVCFPEADVRDGQNELTDILEKAERSPAIPSQSSFPAIASSGRTARSQVTVGASGANAHCSHASNVSEPFSCSNAHSRR